MENDELIIECKKKNLRETLYLVKRLIKHNNAILFIALIFSAVFVNTNFYIQNPDFKTSEDNGFLANVVII